MTSAEATRRIGKYRQGDQWIVTEAVTSEEGTTMIHESTPRDYWAACSLVREKREEAVNR